MAEYDEFNPPPIRDEEIDKVSDGFPTAAAAVPEKYRNDYGVKFDTRTSTALTLNFQSVETATPKAILLNILNTNTGEIIQQWLPKKLCSNLDLSACVINVWEVFAEDKLGHLWEDK